MRVQPPCFLLTEDPELRTRVLAAMRRGAEVLPVRDVADLKLRLEMEAPALILADTRAAGFLDLLVGSGQDWPGSLLIAFGAQRSDRVLEAQAADVFEVMGLDFDISDLQTRCRRALEHIAVVQALRHAERRDVEAAGSADAGAAGGVQSLSHIVPPLCHGEDVERLSEEVVQGIVRSGVVLRAGIFAWDAHADSFRMVASRGCPADVPPVPRQAPLALWLEANARLVVRSCLRQMEDGSSRLTLQRALDGLGAELIAPLQGRKGLIGWVFLGQRATGQPFRNADLLEITALIGHIATAIENAMLYREVCRQKTLAETVLQTIPTGIVAADEKGVIQWCNEAAGRILHLDCTAMFGKPVEALGSRMADRLRRILAGSEESPWIEWHDPQTRESVSLQTVRLNGSFGCLGVVGFLHDLTKARDLANKEKDAERIKFWGELAAAMSHEIRNPMVSISTFVQLLPERFDDPEFRNDFSQLALKEIERVNRIVNRINDFAYPVPAEFHPVDVAAVVRKACEIARSRVVASQVYELKVELEGDLPVVQGDRMALTEGVANLVVNAIEAVGDREKGIVRVSACARQGMGGAAVLIMVEDNGKGIAEELREVLFSPFSTSKAKGLGLGLPISQRIVKDHNGDLDIQTGPRGTVVSVRLHTGKGVGTV